MKILLVEDDSSVAEVLRQALVNQHYLVDLASDGEEGLELAEVYEYDLILLDLMLPKLDGISFCRERRKEGDRTPILLLTAADTSSNRIMGLDAGADDFVAKPFELYELLARIRALLRRGSSTTTPLLEWGSLCLNPSNCEVTYDDQLLHLTAKEYGLLELFLRNTQRIFSQSALLDHLWSFEEPPSENTVRAHIKSLRQKLKKAGAAGDLIETVYGLGYRLKAEDKSIQNSKSKIQNGTLQAPISNSQTVTEASPTQPSLLPEIAEIWQRSKEKYLKRLTVLEQAVTGLLEGNLTEDLQQKALREAHTLIGSLGSFGLVEASGLTREIEQSFEVGQRLSHEQKEHLQRQVLALRQALEQPNYGLGVNTENLDYGETNHQPNSPKSKILNPKSQSPTTVKLKSRLLVVDDDTELALALSGEAKTWGMEVEVAGNLAQAREAIAHLRPDVVLLDLCFPDSVENGFSLLAELANAQPPVPVLVFTAKESLADRVKAARLGGRGFLQKPVSLEQLKEAIAQVLEQSSPPEAKLLIVDDDPLVLDFLRPLLEPWGFTLTLLDEPQQFWETLEQTTPDLLILDVEMPELSGIDLCQVVRNDPRWQDLPVLFLSAHTDAQTIHRVFAAGADDYVNKPIIGPELVARVLNRLERIHVRRKLRKLMG